MTYADELDSFQTYLEAVRAHPDSEELWEDLQRAKDALEVAYLENLAAGALTAGRKVPPLSAADFDPEVGRTTSDDQGVW